jgi:hypothetical protein
VIDAPESESVRTFKGFLTPFFAFLTHQIQKTFHAVRVIGNIDAREVGPDSSHLPKPATAASDS